MRTCWSITGGLLLLLGACRSDPEVPAWHEGPVHGPVIGSHELTAFFGDGARRLPIDREVPRSRSDVLTFSFALPDAVEDAPLAFDLVRVEEGGGATTPCKVEVAQLNRPPRLPALAVATITVARSACSDDAATLRPGAYRGKAEAGGQTFESPRFEVR